MATNLCHTSRRCYPILQPSLKLVRLHRAELLCKWCLNVCDLEFSVFDLGDMSHDVSRVVSAVVTS